jgi:ketosteroid isomerase-like protein
MYGEIHGRDDYIAYVRGLPDLAADALLSAAQFAGDDSLGVGHTSWRGHLDEGGGGFRHDWIIVCLVGEEGVERIEYFEPEDEPGAVERLLALQPDGAIRAAWKPQLDLVLAMNARDWTRARACFTEGVHLIDHRPGVSGSHPVDTLRSLLDTMPNARGAIQFVDAGPGRAMSRLHLYGHDLAGEQAETAIGQVLVLREGGIARIELFNPDDEAAMRTRLEQLEPDADWDPATRSVQRYFACLNSRDIDGIRAYYTEDFRLVDHRLASPLSGVQCVDEHVAAFEAIFALASDVRMRVEHIGELGGVWLGKPAWVGHQNETGSEFEILMRCVMIWRDRCSRIELFDADDERGALGAMARLLAPPTAGSAPVATDLVLGLVDAIVHRDWDRARGCFAADLETVDHRSLRTLGLDRPGGEGFAERVRGLLALAADAQPRVEPLAELDGIAMALIGWSGHLNEGGGPFELRWRGVFVARDEVIVRDELFDEDDEAGMLAALARLRRLAGADESNPVARYYRRHDEAFHDHDWEALRSLLTEDVVVVDRRPATGWPVIRGRPEVAATMRDLLNMAADLHESFELIEADMECGIVRRALWGHAAEADGGGAFEASVVQVAVLRGPLACYIEMHPPDADLAMLRTRRERLRPLARRRTSAELPTEPLPVEHATLRFTKGIGAGDRTAVANMLDPGLRVLDHRGGDPEDRESFVARLRAASREASRYTVFAASDSLSAGVLTTGDDTLGAVMDWQADRCTRIELFDEDDEAGMLAALARPRATASAPPARPDNV